MSSDEISTLYLLCKDQVIRSGYSWEIDWQFEVRDAALTEPQILAEGAWVILSAGMRETVISKIFEKISSCFFNWNSAEKISSCSRICKALALEHFASPHKIDTILRYVTSVACLGWHEFLNIVRNDGAEFLRTVPKLGPVTSVHLAKNLGCDVVKPDRHLCRVAELLGYEQPSELCSLITERTGEKSSVIDVVFWRFAVLFPEYPSLMQSMLSTNFDRRISIAAPPRMLAA